MLCQSRTGRLKIRDLAVAFGDISKMTASETFADLTLQPERPALAAALDIIASMDDLKNEKAIPASYARKRDANTIAVRPGAM